MSSGKVALTVRLPLELHERVFRQAKKEGRTLNAQVIHLLQDYYSSVPVFETATMTES